MPRKKPSAGTSASRPSTTTLRAGLGAGLDVARHLVPVLGRDQRAHVGARLGAVADLQLREPRRDGVDEPVGDVTHRDGHRDRHAALACRAVGGRDRGVGGEVDVGVGQHHHVVLRAAEGLDPLAVPGAGLVDVAGDRRGADEADRRDVGVAQQAVDGLLVPLQHREDTVGEPGLLPELGEEQRRRGVLLAGLEDEGVAGGDRVRAHPQRHHHREVERGDAGDDAERLADRVDVDAGARLLGEAALHQVRHTGGELDVLESSRDLAGRVRENLAVLGGHDLGELSGPLVQQLPEREEHRGPLGQRGAAPPLGRGLGALDRLLDVVGARELDVGRLLPGGRVEHGRGTAGGARGLLSVDPVGDALGHGLSLSSTRAGTKTRMLCYKPCAPCSQRWRNGSTSRRPARSPQPSAARSPTARSRRAPSCRRSAPWRPSWRSPPPRSRPRGACSPGPGSSRPTAGGVRRSSTPPWRTAGGTAGRWTGPRPSRRTSPPGCRTRPSCRPSAGCSPTSTGPARPAATSRTPSSPSSPTSCAVTGPTAPSSWPWSTGRWTPSTW